MKLRDGHPLGLGLGFEVSSHLGHHGRAIAVDLHEDDAADPLLDPSEPGGALRQLGPGFPRERAHALGQAVPHIGGGIRRRDGEVNGPKNALPRQALANAQPIAAHAALAVRDAPIIAMRATAADLHEPAATSALEQASEEIGGLLVRHRPGLVVLRVLVQEHLHRIPCRAIDNRELRTLLAQHVDVVVHLRDALARGRVALPLASSERKFADVLRIAEQLA